MAKYYLSTNQNFDLRNTTDIAASIRLSLSLSLWLLASSVGLGRDLLKAQFMALRREKSGIFCQNNNIDDDDNGDDGDGGAKQDKKNTRKWTIASAAKRRGMY